MKRLKLLVRKNLKMSSGKIAAQCVHAALGLNKKLNWDDLPMGQFPDREYLDPMKSVVVLEVSDVKFGEAKTSLAASQNSFYVVTDAGYTEVAAHSETVIAFLEDDPRCYKSNSQEPSSGPVSLTS